MGALGTRGQISSSCGLSLYLLKDFAEFAFFPNPGDLSIPHSELILMFQMLWVLLTITEFACPYPVRSTAHVTCLCVSRAHVLEH